MAESEPATIAADGPDETTERVLRAAATRRTYIDEPHPSIRAYDWPAATEGAIALEAAARDAANRRTHRRVDYGVKRTPAIPVLPQRPADEQKQAGQTLAERVFQWHAALAPHAGIIVTLGLILSAAILWRLTIGQPRTAGNGENVLDIPATWPAETTSRSTALPVSDDGGASSIELPIMWRAAEIESNAAPATGAEATSNQLIRTLPPSDFPATVPATKMANALEPLAPTPVTMPYPTTPFVEYQFSAPQNVTPAAPIADEAQAAVLAKRPDAVETMSTTPR